MKKILVMLIVLSLMLSGCMQSDAAKAMDEQIVAIGEVTLDGLVTIESAEEAYNNLDEADQKQVRKYKMLVEARASYSKLKADEVDGIITQIGQVSLDSSNSIVVAEKAYDALTADEQQFVEQYEALVEARNSYSQLRADSVIDNINSIGKVGTNSYNKINSAEKSYNELANDKKELVINYDVLVAAWADYDKCCAENVENKIASAINDASQLDAAEKAYQALTASQKTLVGNYDQLVNARINFVMVLIDNLDNITLESGGAIQTAENEYNKLSSSEKNRVTNSGKISDAKTRLDELRKQERASKKKALLKKVNENTDEVKGITWYTSTSEPRYRNSYSYVLPYIGISEDNILRMRLVYDYAGNDWIFFDEATIVTDENKYTRSFNYFDVNRKTSFGAKLSERADVLVDKDDLAMLRDMASSSKVIVRLEGDGGHKDITLSSSDKQAIADIIALYDLLSEEDGVRAASG